MTNVVKLGEVCNILNGYAFKSSDYVDSGYRVIRITNVQKGFIEDKNPVYYPNVLYDDFKSYILEKNDILISLTGNVGRVALLDESFLPAVLNQRVACLRMKNNILYRPYLFHLLNSDYFEEQCKINSKGIAQKNLSTQWLKNFDFSVCCYRKQVEIANNFDQLDSVIVRKTQQINKLDELVKARFVEMFGDPVNNPMKWEKCKFEDISVVITDGEHKTPRRTTNGIYLLSARNIVNHSIQVEDVDYIDDEEYNRISKRIIPQSGDILLTCSGSVGRCCIVPKDFKFQMVRSVALIRFCECINPIFMEWLIESEYVQRQISQSLNQSSQPNLFQSKIRKLKAYLPPIELQNEFAVFVEQVEKSKKDIQQSLEKLETLKKSLMQEYFG